MVDIGNNLGKHLKTDLERTQVSLTTYAHMCGSRSQQRTTRKNDPQVEQPQMDPTIGL
jgi:hypothetical protein